MNCVICASLLIVLLCSIFSSDRDQVGEVETWSSEESSEVHTPRSRLPSENASAGQTTIIIIVLQMLYGRGH